MSTKIIKYEEFLRYQKGYDINDVDKYLVNLKDLIPYHLRYSSKRISFDIIPDNSFIKEDSLNFRYKVRILSGSLGVKKYFEQTGPFFVFIVI